MLPNEATQPAYTFADLLRDLQALTPEQLAQEAKAWGEHPIYNLERVEVLAENYVADGGEAWPASDFGPDAEDEEVYAEKGTVVIWTC